MNSIIICECKKELKSHYMFFGDALDDHYDDHSKCEFYYSIEDNKILGVCLRIYDDDVIVYHSDYEIRKYKYANVSGWAFDRTISESTDINFDLNVENVFMIIDHLKKIKENIMFL